MLSSKSGGGGGSGSELKVDLQMTEQEKKSMDFYNRLVVILDNSYFTITRDLPYEIHSSSRRRQLWAKQAKLIAYLKQISYLYFVPP